MNNEEALTWTWPALLSELAKAKLKNEIGMAGRGGEPIVGEDSEASPSDSSESEESGH